MLITLKMFENIRLIENNLNNMPYDYRGLTLNQGIKLVVDIIDSNNISLKWLMFETFIYCIYLSIKGIWNYTNWSICKPVQTIQSINRICSSVQFQIIPRKFRCYMYGQLLKTLVIDLIRTCIVGFIYFKIQQMLMW